MGYTDLAVPEFLAVPLVIIYKQRLSVAPQEYLGTHVHAAESCVPGMLI